MKSFHVKPYSPKTLSSLYGVSIKTFRKWLLPFQDQIGRKNGHYYTSLQVKIIVEKIGVPDMLIE